MNIDGGDTDNGVTLAIVREKKMIEKMPNEKKIAHTK